MTHEKFKVFEQYNSNYTNVEKFINTGHVVPRSISLASGYCVIGYEEDLDQTEHQYQIVTRIVPIIETKSDVEGDIGIGYVGASKDKEVDASGIEAEANALNGVICQDVVWYNGNFIITFLTTKE